MTIKIENAAFSAEIDTKGAELQNLIRKNDGMDIIWHGDKTVWGNHAPILFPYQYPETYVAPKSKIPPCELAHQPVLPSGKKLYSPVSR